MCVCVHVCMCVCVLSLRVSFVVPLASSAFNGLINFLCLALNYFTSPAVVVVVVVAVARCSAIPLTWRRHSALSQAPFRTPSVAPPCPALPNCPLLRAHARANGKLYVSSRLSSHSASLLQLPLLIDWLRCRSFT